MKIETLTDLLISYNNEKHNPAARIKLPYPSENVMVINKEFISSTKIKCGDGTLMPLFTFSGIQGTVINNVSSLLNILRAKKFQEDAEALVVLKDYDFNTNNMVSGSVLEIGGVYYDEKTFTLFLLTNYTDNEYYKNAVLSESMFNCLYFDRCKTIATKLTPDIVVLDKVYNITVYFEGEEFFRSKANIISVSDGDEIIASDITKNMVVTVNSGYQYKITRVSNNDLVIAMYKRKD